MRSGAPRRWRLAGCAAAVALAAASWGAGSLPTLHTRVLWPGLAWQAPTGGSPLLATVSVAAMAVLVLAWWRLRDAAVTARWWQQTSLAWFVPLVASAPLYSRDLYSYAAQGALWHAGLSPYEHGVRDLASDWRGSTAPTWLDSPAPYGPVWLLLARGAAAASGGNLVVALGLLRVVAVLGVVVLVVAVPWLARRLGVVDPSRATWLAVAVPLVGAHLVSGAHNDALMVAGVLGGLVLALRRRFALACVVLSLAAMVKVTAVVVVPFVALLWAADHAASSRGASVRWRDLVRAGSLCLVATALPTMALGLSTGLGFGWLNPAATSGRNEQWTSLPTALGMAVGAIGHVLGTDGWRDPGIAVMRGLGLGVLLVVLVLLWLTTARWAGDPARVVRAAGLALLAVVVLAPAFLGWYYLWVLPVLAVCVDPDRHRRTVTWIAVAAAVLCFAQLPDGYSLGLTTTAVGVPLAVVATGLLVRAGWRWARRTDWRALALREERHADAGT
ncbi:MAG TPA: polyprenol phosphomannose-dependent alpha 1,6 mannosyltransferase MptB [Intrasporangium sp.]|uniref:polyprenol phosphomannose-dependent alpha 1,6 mannosyltransferase MptB n=1 Tax=Intrasporangium sp. TaxID=1925024 RepID=UPI002D78CF05|nr:polyprenol phosphomannose-dependent alpha 1,6 mannosyltransferase MptB [Intrasporangium sp.]HET7397193.1 polyprenol phosphomannose-dependent alpha 1,6 mannosyltransferase MptB [Intrasporangium sp.]